MLNKESYLKNLDILDSIMKRNSLDKVIGEKIDVTRKNINEYITRILLIGEFSAGKSAFINKLIDRDDLLKWHKLLKLQLQRKLCMMKMNMSNALQWIMI